MSPVEELPDLVSDLVRLSKAYLTEEALGPARRLGRMAAFSVGAALCFAVAGLLLAVAGMRWLTGQLREEWSWAGYVGSSAAVGLVAAAVLLMGRR